MTADRTRSGTAKDFSRGQRDAAATAVRGVAVSQRRNAAARRTPAIKVKHRSTRKPSKADQVYQLLRHRIVTLELAPGSWFRERDISTETGFGAMPLREAVDRLEQEGLIRTVPRRGNQVTPLSAKYVRDFFDIWFPLAVSVCRMACVRATEEQILSITQMIEEVERVIVKSETDPRIMRLTEETFMKMVEAADNEHFDGIWRRMSGINQRIFEAAYQKDPGIARMVIHDKRQIAAWRARDVETLATMVEAYLSNARASVLRSL
jgi:DNA-binding GntR family transcriptional regulator